MRGGLGGKVTGRRVGSSSRGSDTAASRGTPRVTPLSPLAPTLLGPQFQLSFAKMIGSKIPLRTMIASNWVPVTIGNIIGGAFFVGTLYAGGCGGKGGKGKRS